MSLLVIGAEGGFYQNGGTWGQPVWAENLLIKDVKVNLPFDFAEFTDRSVALKRYKKSLADVAVQATVRADPTLAAYQALVLAALTRNTFLDLLILNTKRTVVGGVGVRGNFVLSMQEEPQVLADGVYTTFDLKPTDDAGGNILYAVQVADVAGALSTLSNFAY